MTRIDAPTDALVHEDEQGGFVTTGVARQRLSIVNVVFIGNAHEWVLVDAGVGTEGSAIRTKAEALFAGSPPKAIVLTHGHFDHVGSALELAQHWNIPVFAHELEMPYLDGRSSYPAPDPSVGGGLFSTLSRFFPRGPIDQTGHLEPLPADSSIPFLPGWTWLHTPGHTVGHISLWRESDRTLVAGDAVITTAQESAYAVVTQRAEFHGPPKYYTIDWDKSRGSARRLAELEPDTLVTGHGPALHGPAVRKGLHELADRFEEIAVPDTGKYVEHSAKVKTGEAYPGDQ